MSISNDDCIVAEHLIRASGAGRLLCQALRKDPRGGKLKLDPEIYLIGMLLAAIHSACTYLTEIHRILTQEVPPQFRIAWGIDYYADGALRQVTYEDIKNMSRRIQRQLDYSPERYPDLPPNCTCPQPPAHGQCKEPMCAGQDRSSERLTRANTVQSILDAVIRATLVPRPEGAADYAIDSTGLWAHERAKGSPPRTAQEDNADNEPDAADETLATATDNPTKRRRAPSDAGWGVKTSKSGSRMTFFGYEAHAVVRVPEEHPHASIGKEPALLEALRVTPASKDIVDPTLSMIDQITATGQKIRHVIVDRHYSYKRFDRWLLRLIERRIQQVLDLRDDEQGFRSWDGIPFAASWAHCPRTPEHLGTIPTLPPNATAKQIEDFHRLIEQRWAYAAQRSGVMTSDGKVRYRCPALAGKIGCALVPGSEQAAVNLGLPVVVGAPEREHAPALCCQGTWGAHITTSEHEVIMKGYQQHYWGSPKQRQLFGRRTFVESWFSILKSPNSAGKNRESSLHRGLAMVSLEIGLFAAIANMIRLRGWYRSALEATAQALSTGRDLGIITSLHAQHPLLQNLKTSHTVIPMTEDEWIERVRQAKEEIAELKQADDPPHAA